MQFGTFTFPNDPESLHVTYQREYQMSATTTGLWSVSSPSLMGCIVEGEGVFYGTNALSSFDSLLFYLKQGTAMTLSLPEWSSTFKAILVKLELAEDSCENYVRYCFKFIEIPS